LADGDGKRRASSPSQPPDDHQNRVNAVTGQRIAGSEIRYGRAAGPLSVQDPPPGVGRYSGSGEFNVYSNDDLPSIAGWQVHKGTVDDSRNPKPQIKLTNPRTEDLRRSVA